MIPKLKQFRARLGLTQFEIAKAVGVSQPNYQRWEAGTAPIPDDKLAKLAKSLETSPDALMGRHAPITVSIYDDSVSDELSYYGEVAIHFQGGGDPLLLSISEGAFSRLYRDIQHSQNFITVQSLANQTVVVRVKAIADLTFSSEAYDTYGPEHGRYRDFADIRIPDPRDWAIIASLALDEVGIEDFDPADVERVSEWVMVTDAQFEKLVTDNAILPENLDVERAKMADLTAKIFALATNTVYQFSKSVQRSVTMIEPESLYNAFYPLTEFDGDHPEDEMLLLEAEGRHRVYFINPAAIDFISIPTHTYEEGRDIASAEMIDALEVANVRKTLGKRTSASKGHAPSTQLSGKGGPPARRGRTRR